MTYSTVLLADLCRGRCCVGGRGFVYASGVSSLRNTKSVMGGLRGVGHVALGTLAVGRGLQVVLWKEQRRQVKETGNHTYLSRTELLSLGISTG